MGLEQLSSAYTITAVYLAWFIFFIERKYRLETNKREKENILKPIKEELELLKYWFGTSYSDQNYKQKQEPWHPFHMVYGLGNNEAIKNAISTKNINLLSENLRSALITLNQKLGSFNQHIERLISFNTSNPIVATKAFFYYDRNYAKLDKEEKWLKVEKLANKLNRNSKIDDEEIYLVGSMRMLKDLHVIGIGSENEPEKLRYSYLEVQNLIDKELKNIDKEKQFEQRPIFTFLDTAVFGSFLLLSLFFLFYEIDLEGGVNIVSGFSIENVSYIANVVLAIIAIWGIINERKLNELKVLFGVVKGWSKQIQSASNSNSVILSKVRNKTVKKPEEIEAALDAQGCYLNGLHISFQEELDFADKILGYKK